MPGFAQTNIGPIKTTTQDSVGQTTPANPPANQCRGYYNSGTGLMAWINHAGTTCGPSGGGGGGGANVTLSNLTDPMALNVPITFGTGVNPFAVGNYAQTSTPSTTGLMTFGLGTFSSVPGIGYSYNGGGQNVLASLTSSISGNANTASAANGTPTTCSGAGQFATGVAGNFNAVCPITNFFTLPVQSGGTVSSSTFGNFGFTSAGFWYSVNGGSVIFPNSSYPTLFQQDSTGGSAASTLEQINGATSQTYRLYHSFSSSTNFSRLQVTWNATDAAWQFGSNSGSGGGTAGNIEFATGSVPTARWSFSSGSPFSLSPLTDNAYDIGCLIGGSSPCNGSFAFRVRNIHVGTGVDIQGAGGQALSVPAGPAFGYSVDQNGVVHTSGATAPTVDVTAAFNAMITAKCATNGCDIALGPGYYALQPTTGSGTQIAIPLNYNGIKMHCAGGPGPQYSANYQQGSCVFYILTPGLYAMGCGVFGTSTTPAAGPHLENLTFADATTKNNAGGAFYSADCNGSILVNPVLLTGFRQTAIAAPSAPTCGLSGGGTITAATFTVKLQAWTTTGPSLPGSACGSVAPSSQAVTYTVPTPVFPIIAYEALCSVNGGAYYTCSPFASYVTNADGSLTLTPGNTANGTVTTDNHATAHWARAPVLVDASHSGGLAFFGSDPWGGHSGYSNEPRIYNPKCTYVQGCVTAGIGSADVQVYGAEGSSCDVLVSSGACDAPANGTTILATPGTFTGFGALRLFGIHGTGFGSTTASGGNFITFTGFNNQISLGVIQSVTGGGSTETGVALVSSTKAMIEGLVVANYNNCFTADAASTRNNVRYASNGSCQTTPAFTDSGTFNLWNSTDLEGTPTLTKGTNVTSMACASGFTCTNWSGTVTFVGGTATTGTIGTVTFSSSLGNAPTCMAWMNGGATSFGIGNGAATATAFTITAAVSVGSSTFNVNYQCSNQ